MADDDLFFCDSCGDVFLDEGAKKEHESEVHGVRYVFYLPTVLMFVGIKLSYGKGLYQWHAQCSALTIFDNPLPINQN